MTDNYSPEAILELDDTRKKSKFYDWLRDMRDKDPKEFADFNFIFNEEKNLAEYEM